MDNMNLAEAFALYGAEGPRRAPRMSALAQDGAVVLGCSSRRFSRPAAGVLRYEDTLSDEGVTAEALRSLRAHLELALKDSLPVRMIVITESATAGKPATRTVHVRQDLVGRVTNLDNERFVVDFVKADKPV